MKSWGCILESHYIIPQSPIQVIIVRPKTLSVIFIIYPYHDLYQNPNYRSYGGPYITSCKSSPRLWASPPKVCRKKTQACNREALDPKP